MNKLQRILGSATFFLASCSKPIEPTQRLSRTLYSQNGIIEYEFAFECTAEEYGRENAFRKETREEREAIVMADNKVPADLLAPEDGCSIEGNLEGFYVRLAADGTIVNMYLTSPTEDKRYLPLTSDLRSKVYHSFREQDPSPLSIL